MATKPIGDIIDPNQRPPRMIDVGLGSVPNPAYAEWMRTHPNPLTPPAPETTTPIPAPPSAPAPTPGVPGQTTPEPSPLPGIPAMPSIYTGKAPDYYAAQINALLPTLNKYKQALRDIDSGANTTFQDRASVQTQIDQLTGQLNDLMATKLTAQQGFAANTTQQSRLSMLPGLESFLNTNLTDQTKFAVSQINPLIEQRLNALGILDSGALAATESKSLENLLRSQNARVGDFMTGALESSSLGLSDSQYQDTLQALLGSTQRTFAQQDLASQTSLAQQLQQQTLQAQREAQVPFWQQLLLSSIGGASQGIGQRLGRGF